ncbi:hypothetical protein [Anaerosinus massiliensis]|uniref:hypothetical protein n=1 Tax=Massilibacillus massiliensis TaxID=1806837 RepID=UPI000DA6007F|nr:hypothetical protein [Massilibacillus massiliensis]
MTLDDWIKRYEKKAEKFSLIPGFSIYYEPDKGFFCYKITGNVFEVDHTCTNDVKHLVTVAQYKAKKHNCKVIVTQTLHDPAVFMRLLKWNIRIDLSGIRDNGKMYWVFEKEVI